MTQDQKVSKLSPNQSCVAPELLARVPLFTALKTKTKENQRRYWPSWQKGGRSSYSLYLLLAADIPKFVFGAVDARATSCLVPNGTTKLWDRFVLPDVGQSSNGTLRVQQSGDAVSNFREADSAVYAIRRSSIFQRQPRA